MYNIYSYTRGDVIMKHIHEFNPTGCNDFVLFIKCKICGFEIGINKNESKILCCNGD